VSGLAGDEAPRRLERELVPRAATLLARGALPAVLALVLLGGASLALTWGALALENARTFDTPAFGFVLTAFFGTLATPLLAHAAPLAAFALAVQGPPTLRATLGRAARAAPGLLVPTFAMFIPAGIATFGVGVAAAELGHESGKLLATIIINGVTTSCAAWLQGRYVVLPAASHVLGRAWRPVEHPLQVARVAAIGAPSVVVFVAFVGHAMTRPAPAVGVEAVLIAGGAIAAAAVTLVGTAALAVAFVSLPLHPAEPGDGEP